MKFLYDIPSSFWGLFRSVNRDIYIEALLVISEEYQYNNYFLSRETCVQLLSDMYSEHRFRMEREDLETDEEAQEAIPRRILNWLIRAGWLRKVEDYSTMATNIVIPDYAAVLVEAFELLVHAPEEDTEIYIQNVYATLFSFRNDPRMNISMLKTALINTKKLNKALQDMLHNMDQFFDRLLEKNTYGELLREHLEGYVGEVVEKKYHILKTSDNFYIYKMDIKNCLKEMREDDEWQERVRAKQRASQTAAGSVAAGGSSANDTAAGRNSQTLADLYARRQEDDVLDLLDQIERGFDMIERRITNMDREHSKYVRATVSRLNYLLSEENDRHGLLIQLLNRLGESEDESVLEARLSMTAGRMNLSASEILHENPLFHRRKRKNFLNDLEPEEENAELSMEEILRLNKLQHRFTRKQVEEFVEMHMEDGCLDTGSLVLSSEEDFEKLILAYDLSMRRNSRFEVVEAGYQLEDGKYTYPAMMFIERKGKKDA